MNASYYRLMACANKHQARAHAVHAEASRLEPFASAEDRAKREATYLEMAASARNRAADYKAMAEDAQCFDK